MDGKKRFVDDAKATEHHAVVPTERNPDDYKNDPAYQLSPDEEKLYELILKHTLAAFHPEGLDRETEVITEVAGERFLSKSLFVLSPVGENSITRKTMRNQTTKTEVPFLNYMKDFLLLWPRVNWQQERHLNPNDCLIPILRI